MSMARSGGFVVGSLACVLSAAGALVSDAAAQAAAASNDSAAVTAPATGSPVLDYAHDLERIRDGLAREHRLVWNLDRMPLAMFRVNVEGELPDIETWLGDVRALQVGNVTTPYYHAEFLGMITPKDLQASYTNGEMAQLLATGVAGGLALRGLAGLVSAVKGAVAAGRRTEACREVADSLTGLNAERVKAGLAPVPVPEC